MPTINVTATGGISYAWSGGLTPNTAENSFTDPGTYTLTVSNDDGCSNTSFIAITQDILAPIISISTNSPICAGEELLLSANNGISYSWSGPNGFSSSFENPSIVDATSAETGEYSVTVTGANGCTSSEQTSVVVNAVIAHFSHMTNGLTVSFSNNSIDATSYTWDFSGMGSSNLENPEFTFPSDGVYSVSLVATNGNCSDSSSQQITLTNVGIATNDLNIFNIYPNPASKTLTVQVSAEAINKTLSIYDVTGRLVFQKQVESLQEELNISNLVTGVYEIQINTDPKKLHKRLMVN